jgi:ribosomal-protein-alanine N-acetyltransferase
MTDVVVQVRIATSADAEAIARLEESSFSEPWSLHAIQCALADYKYCIIVAQRAEAVIGFALGWNVGEEGEIARVAVLPAERGHGIGQQLMLATLQEMKQRSVQELFLEVRPSNVAAINLYNRCGFTEAGRRRKYYSDGEDAVILRLHLV